MESSHSPQGQPRILKQNNVQQNKIVGGQDYIPPHLRGLKRFDPKVLNGHTSSGATNNTSSSDDPKVKSHIVTLSATPSTQPDLTPLPSQTSGFSSPSVNGKNTKSVLSYADAIKSPSQLQATPSPKKLGPSSRAKSGTNHLGPVSILKGESQGSSKHVPIAPNLLASEKSTANTQSRESVHVRFDELGHFVGDKTIGLVQQLATDEEPLKAPAFEINGLSNNLKSKNFSVISNDEEDGDKSIGQRSNAAPKIDNYGFEITKTKLEYELAGWDGNWAPAPIEWDARPAFNNNDSRHVKFIEKWMNERVTEALANPHILDLKLKLYTSGEGPSSGLHNFLWAPYPVNWTCHRPNDPFTNTPENLAQNSLDSQKEFSKVFFAEKKKRNAEIKEAQEYNRQYWESTVVSYPNNNSPKANIYIRPVQQSDVAQITAIYNSFVQDCPLTLEINPVDQDVWRRRFRMSEEERLPFMVAVLKHSKGGNDRSTANGRGRNVRRENRRRGPIIENIVGYAVAEDFAGRYTAFGPTVEMMIFVHPDHQRLGVGNTLLDRMMPALDPVYLSKNGTEFIYDGLQCYELGGAREIHKIIVNIGYYPKDPHTMQWQKDWLIKDWQFEHVATLPGVGMKNNRR